MSYRLRGNLTILVGVFDLPKKIAYTESMKEFSVIIEQDEDGYFVASVPALRGCHTQAKSLDVLMKRIREAVELCLEEEQIFVPSKFIGVQRVTVPS